MTTTADTTALAEIADSETITNPEATDNPPEPKWAFPIDWDHNRSPEELRDLLGGKGAALNEMTRLLGLPVPPGFTLVVGADKADFGEVWAEVEREIERLERLTGRKFDPLDDSEPPLLVSVRSGAKVSMPGMMDTALNVGLSPRANDILVEKYGSRFVTSLIANHRVRSDYRYNFSGQFDLTMAVKSVWESWDSPRARSYRQKEGIPHDLGTAVTVQMMVYGNLNERSGTGVAFTRNPNTGENTPYGDFLLTAQGEEVVNGSKETMRLDDMRMMLPDAHNRLVEIFKHLEHHYKDMCDVEFTVENGELFILQTRVGKRATAATARILVDMANESIITREEAVSRITPNDLVDIPTKRIVESAETEVKLLGEGLPASPGLVVGVACFHKEDIKDFKGAGHAVIYCAETTSPDDVAAFVDADAILTKKGGLLSHAAVVARGWNKPAVVGVSLLPIPYSTITLDGSTGRVYKGEVETIIDPNVNQYRDTLLAWADEVRGEHQVFSRADSYSEISDPDSSLPILTISDIPLLKYAEKISATILDKAPLDIVSDLRADYREMIKAAGKRPVNISLANSKPSYYLTSLRDLHLKQEIYGLNGEERKIMGFITSERAAWAPEILDKLIPGLWIQQVAAIINAVIDNTKGGKRPQVTILLPDLDDASRLFQWLSRIGELCTSIGTTRHKKVTVDVGAFVTTPAGLYCLSSVPNLQTVIIDTASIRRRLGSNDNSLVEEWLPRDSDGFPTCSVINDFMVDTQKGFILPVWWYPFETNAKRLLEAQRLLAKQS